MENITKIFFWSHLTLLHYPSRLPPATLIVTLISLYNIVETTINSNTMLGQRRLLPQLEACGIDFFALLVGKMVAN